MRGREVELEVEEHTIKPPSSFQEVISILVLAIPAVQISAPIPQSEGLQLGLLGEQSILPSHFCITTLSAHAALIMFLNLLFENIVQRTPKSGLFVSTLSGTWVVVLIKQYTLCNTEVSLSALKTV